MKIHRWALIPTEQMNPLVTRQVLHSGGMTIARLRLKSGALIPRHSHPNEQISTIESGRLKFIFDDGEAIAGVGESVEIPPGVPHAVEALEDAVALDFFTPVREDWMRGDDAYLRGT